jgi:hypothetical protein
MTDLIEIFSDGWEEDGNGSGLCAMTSFDI